MSLLTLWGLVLLFPRVSVPFSRLILPSLVIAGVEYLFHLFLGGKEPMPANHPPDNPG